ALVAAPLLSSIRHEPRARRPQGGARSSDAVGRDPLLAAAAPADEPHARSLGARAGDDAGPPRPVALALDVVADPERLERGGRRRRLGPQPSDGDGVQEERERERDDEDHRAEPWPRAPWEDTRDGLLGRGRE